MSPSVTSASWWIPQKQKVSSCIYEMQTRKVQARNHQMRTKIGMKRVKKDIDLELYNLFKNIEHLATTKFQEPPYFRGSRQKILEVPVSPFG